MSAFDAETGCIGKTIFAVAVFWKLRYSIEDKFCAQMNAQKWGFL